MKTTSKFAVAFGIFLLALASVSAFAISSKYYDGNPLIISPGETRDISIILQNLAGDSNITAQGIILEGSDIASIINPQDNYTIPLGEKLEIGVRVNVPKTMTIGTNKTITLSFKTLTIGTQGAMGFGASVESSIPVTILAAEKTPSSSKSMNWLIYLIAGLVLIILIILIAVKGSTKNNKK